MRLCVNRMPCFFTVLVFLSVAVFAAETRTFSLWQLTIPDGIRVESASAQQLLLKLELDPSAGVARIRFDAARPLGKNPSKFVSDTWQREARGLQLLGNPEQEAIGLMDDVTKGLRYYAQFSTTQGNGVLMVDTYFAGEHALVMVTKADSEISSELVHGMLTLIHMNMALGPQPTSPAQHASVDKVPPKATPYPYKESDWQPEVHAVRTSFDLEAFNERSAVSAFLRLNQKRVGSQAKKSVTFSEALKNVARVLKVEKNASALATVQSLPMWNSADDYISAAAVSLASRKPENALALLWLAQEKFPNHPSVLFNMAALMSMHGDANTSSALLNEVQRLGAPDHAFGVDAQTGVQYLGSYNQMLQGDVKAAMATIKPITKKLPELGEASLLRALLAAQLKEDVAEPLFMGVYRRPKKAVMKDADKANGDEGDSDEGDSDKDNEEDTRLSARYYVDMSKGKDGVINAIFQPSSLETAKDFWEKYKTWHLVLSKESEERNQAVQRLDDAWRGKKRSEQSQQHLEQLERMFTEANAPLPELKSLIAKQKDAIEDWIEAQERISESLGKKLPDIAQIKKPVEQCKAMRNAVSESHARIRMYTQHIDQTTRNVHRLWHRYATALAQLSSDRDYRSYLKARIELVTHEQYAALVANMAQTVIYSDLVEDCTEIEKAEAEKKKAQQAELAKCDGDVNVGLEFTSGFPVKAEKPLEASIGIEANCEGFSIEASAEIFDKLGLSLETEFKKDGNMTLYLGPKFEASVEGISQYGEGKVGVYVSMNQESFTDVGVKATTKIGSKVEFGNVKATVSVGKEVGKISFLPAPNPPSSGSFGLSSFGGN